MWSVLWNGKVVPLLRNVVRGAIWMQGEANAGGDGRQYNCSFQAMIEDWRAKWVEGTGGVNDPAFPFGWAQLNSNGDATTWTAGNKQVRVCVCVCWSHSSAPILGPQL